MELIAIYVRDICCIVPYLDKRYVLAVNDCRKYCSVGYEKWKMTTKNDQENRSNCKNELETISKHFAWYVFARVDTN